MEALLILAGVFFGISISAFVIAVRGVAGTLRIDRSNPSKDIYRIDINDLDKLAKKSRIVLKVDNNADLSQK